MITVLPEPSDGPRIQHHHLLSHVLHHPGEILHKSATVSITRSLDFSHYHSLWSISSYLSYKVSMEQLFLKVNKIYGWIPNDSSEKSFTYPKPKDNWLYKG